jgi:hypothetical protein
MTRYLPRYDRASESPSGLPGVPVITRSDLETALEASALSDGSRDIVRALIRLAKPARFPGGGVGLEYGPLLKTAARPDILARHIAEVSRHLQADSVDLLVLPGMSGYPIGAMYAQAAGIPALLLKKQPAGTVVPEDLPAGAFIIPSYTGNTDTVISADFDAARDMVSGIVNSQLAEQTDDSEIAVEIRIGGADDIIDKATMATAITENAPVFLHSVIDRILKDREAEFANRTVRVRASVVSWVTPLLKAYAGAPSSLTSRFGIMPLAGAVITAIQLDPPAIGIEGIGLVLLEEKS